MRLRLQLRTMLLALRRSGSRGGMACGAVALGIAAMMIMLALAAGAERELQAIVDQMGRNLFAIKPARVNAPRGRYVSNRLSRRDLDLLAAQVPDIAALVPVVEGSVAARFEQFSITMTVRGVTPEFVAVRNFALADGRLLEDADEAARSRAAVLGSFVAEKLNAGVGDTVWIGSAPFDVVGVLAEKGMSDGQNEDDQILVPLTTAERRLFNADSLSRLLVQVRDRERMPVARERARDVLRASHRLGDGVKDDFEILNLIRANEIRRINSQFMQGLSRLFALVTLAIGGVGVLVVTYLNVKDRTAEIGLRMAIGARARDIALLFVSEACLLSVSGGAAGLLLGSAAVLILERALGWQMAVEPRGVMLSFATSVVLGVLFSVAPGLRAARVMPVDALRDA